MVDDRDAASQDDDEVLAAVAFPEQHVARCGGTNLAFGRQAAIWSDVGTIR
jgi:hypothetical protein